MCADLAEVPKRECPRDRQRRDPVLDGMKAPLRMIRAAAGHYDPFRRTMLIGGHDNQAADPTRREDVIEVAMPKRQLIRRGAVPPLDARHPSSAIAQHPESGALGGL